MSTDIPILMLFLLFQITQIPGYGAKLYQLGLVDESQAQHFTDTETQVVSMIKQGQYKAAFLLFDALLNCDFCMGG